MEYGRIAERDIAKIDKSLPADAEGNGNVLSGKRGKPKIYMGTPKWGRKEWIGKLYPKGTKDNMFLDHYLNHFNAIELNATHYKIYDSKEISKWAEKAQGKDFKFCPKFVNSISHYSGFNNVKELTDKFLDGISAFSSNLGPVFLSLSENFSPDRRDKVFAYLKTLPKNIQFFLEVRHMDWFKKEAIREELLAVLKETKVGSVITDTLAHRDRIYMDLTIPKSFIRFVCPGDNASDKARIDAWAERIKAWQDKGLAETYFFIHTNNDEYSPEVAGYLADKFNRVCGSNLPEIKLLPPGTLF